MRPTEKKNWIECVRRWSGYAACTNAKWQWCRFYVHDARVHETVVWSAILDKVINIPILALYSHLQSMPPAVVLLLLLWPLLYIYMYIFIRYKRQKPFIIIITIVFEWCSTARREREREYAIQQPSSTIFVFRKTQHKHRSGSSSSSSDDGSGGGSIINSYKFYRSTEDHYIYNYSEECESQKHMHAYDEGRRRIFVSFYSPPNLLKLFSFSPHFPAVVRSRSIYMDTDGLLL